MLFLSPTDQPTVGDYITKGLLGMSGVAGGVGVSLAVAIQWLQLVSLLVGIAVGVASFVSIALSIARNKRKNSE